MLPRTVATVLPSENQFGGIDIAFEQAATATSEFPTFVRMRQEGTLRRWDSLTLRADGFLIGNIIVTDLTPGGSNMFGQCIWLSRDSASDADVSCASSINPRFSSFLWSLDSANVLRQRDATAISGVTVDCFDFADGIANTQGEVCVRQTDKIPMRLSVRAATGHTAIYEATNIAVATQSLPSLPATIVTALSGGRSFGQVEGTFSIAALGGTAR
jgi:hypothetical protein